MTLHLYSVSSLNHDLCCVDFSLADGARCLDTYNDTGPHVHQVVVEILHF